MIFLNVTTFKKKEKGIDVCLNESQTFWYLNPHLGPSHTTVCVTDLD